MYNNVIDRDRVHAIIDAKMALDNKETLFGISFPPDQERATVKVVWTKLLPF